MSADLKISQMTPSAARPAAAAMPWVGGTPVDNYKGTLLDITGIYHNFTAGDRALAAVPTAGWAPEGGVYFVVTGDTIYPYVVKAGTDAQSVPDVIRPSDYAPTTNEVIYKLLTIQLGGVAVGDVTLTDSAGGAILAANGSGNRNVTLTPTGASGAAVVNGSGILTLDNGTNQATYRADGTASYTAGATFTPASGSVFTVALGAAGRLDVTNTSGPNLRLSNAGTAATVNLDLYSTAANYGRLAYMPNGGANDGLNLIDARPDSQAKVLVTLQAAEVARFVAGNLLLGTATNTSGTGNLVVAGGTVTAGAAATVLTLAGGNTGATLALGAGPTGNITLTPAGSSGNAYVYKSTGNSYLYLQRATAAQGQVALQLSGGTGGTDWIIYQDIGGNNLDIFGNGANRARFTTTGNFLIGGTTDTGSEGKLQVNSTISALGTGGALGNGTGTGYSPAFYAPNTSGTTVQALGFGNSARSGVLRGYQDGGGTVIWQMGAFPSGASFVEHFRVSGSVAGVTTGSAHVYFTTASTSTTTGALQVAGGVGVVGAGWYGEDITITGSASRFLRVTAVNNNALAGAIFTTGNGGSLQVWQLASNISGASGEFTIRDSTAGATALTITKSTLATTLSGNLTVSAGNLTVNGAGPHVFSGNIGANRTVNGAVKVYSQNVNTGSTATAYIQATNGAYQTTIEMPGTAYTTSGPRVANRGYVFSDGAAGMTIHAVNGSLRFWTGNPGTERVVIDQTTGSASFVGSVYIKNATSSSVANLSGASALAVTTDQLYFGDATRGIGVRTYQDGANEAVWHMGYASPSFVTYHEVLRVYARAASGEHEVKITSSRPSTNTTTGALQIGTNVGISGNSGGPSHFGGNLIVNGIPSFNGSLVPNATDAALINAANKSLRLTSTNSTSARSFRATIGTGVSVLSDNLQPYGPATQDDAGLPSWSVNFGGGSGGDYFRILRSPAGSTTLSQLLNVDSSGNLTVSGTGTSQFAGDVIVGTTAGGLYVNPRSAPGNPGTAGASVIYVDSADNQVKIKSSNGTVNVLGGATGNATITGDLTVSGGNVGVGGAVNGGVALYLRTASSGFDTSTSQYGLLSSCTFNSSATTAGVSGYFDIRTAAASFTMVDAISVRVGAPTLGAGSSITTINGLAIANQGAAGITHAYGIDIAAQSGALTTNVGLRNAGTTQLSYSSTSIGVSGSYTLQFLHSGAQHLTLGTDGTSGLIQTWASKPLHLNSQGNDVNIGVASSGQGVSVLWTTASTSTTTGALRVSGGVGVAGALNVGGLVGIGRATGSTTATLEVARSTTGEIFRADYQSSYRIIASDTGVLLGGATLGVVGNLTVSGTGTSTFAGQIELTKNSQGASPSTTAADYAIRLRAADTNTYSNLIGLAEAGANPVTAAIVGVDTGTGGAQGLAFFTGNIAGGMARALYLDSAQGATFGGNAVITGTVSVGPGTSVMGGALSMTSASANIYAVTPGTSQKFIWFQSTGGNSYFGIESSTAGGFFAGSNAYETVIYSPGNTVFVNTPLVRASSNLSLGGAADPFARGYGRALGVNSAGSAALSLNAATGQASYVDVGVNSVRLGSFSGSATDVTVGSITSLPLYLSTNNTARVTIAAADGAITLTGAASITAASATNLTLAGGSSGASLVLGQGANGVATLKSLGTGRTVISSALGSSSPTAAVYNDTTNSRTTLAVIANGSSSQAQIQFGYGSPTSITNTGNIFVSATDFTLTTAGFISFAGVAEWARFTTTGNLLIGGTTDISGSGGLKVFGTTASTSTTTGSLINAGGFGNAGAAWFGGNITMLRAGSGFFTAESTVNGATVELITKGLNSTGTARQANLGINRFADDVFSISDGTTERFRIGITNGNTTVTGNLTVSGTGTSTFAGPVHASTGATVTAADFKNTGSQTLVRIGRSDTTNGAVFGFENSTGTVIIDSVGTSAWPTKIRTGGAQVASFSTSGVGIDGDLTVSGGSVGIGGAFNTSQAISITSTGLVDIFQVGVASGATFSSAATSTGCAFYANTRTAAASYVMANGYGLFVDVATIGAGSSVTAQRGVYIANQGAAGITHAYGIDIAAQSGAATTNIGLRNAGTTQLTNFVSIGGEATTTNQALRLGGTILTGATQYGVVQTMTMTMAATTGYGVWSQIKTTNTLFTLTTGSAITAAAPSVGASSAITTQYGLSVENQGAAGITNAYGIDIAAQSGAATTNVGLRNAGTTLLTNATSASSTTSGALVVTGGIGVGGSGYFGGNIASTRASGSSYIVANAQDTLFISAVEFINNASVTFDIGVGGSTTGVTAMRDRLFVYDGTSVLMHMTPTVSGTTTFTQTTASTNTTNGAVVVTGGVGVGGALNVGSLAAIGGNISTTTGLYVLTQGMTGTAQYGIHATPTFSSGATTTGAGVRIKSSTAAASFTMASMYSILIAAPTVGAASAITTNYGISVSNQGAAGITNAYGIDIAAQSGAATTNVGLRNAGTTILTNTTPSTSAATGALTVAGGVGVDGTVWADAFATTVASVSYSATTNLDFAHQSALTLSLTGNVTFTTSNLLAGRGLRLRIICDGTQRSLSFPGWSWRGGNAPTHLSANSEATLMLFSWGTTDADVEAAYAAEA